MHNLTGHGLVAGYRNNVIDHYGEAGFSVQESLFSWDPRAEMATTYENVELHYRLSPGRVLARVSAGGNTDYPIGRLSLFPPISMRARASDRAENVHALVCRFDRHWLEDLAGTSLDLTPSRLFAQTEIFDADMEMMMRRLSEEVTGNRLASPAMVAGLTRCLAVIIARRFGSVDIYANERDAVLVADRVHYIRQIVLEAQDRLPSVAEIAARCRLSPAHLRRIFREGTGQTLREFLEEARISMACRLLREAELGLKVISFRVGFSHHSAFTFAFRKRMGLTPKDYRLRFC